MNFSIIIPSRTATNLAACLEAIYANEPGIKPEQIIVVDDGIEDASKFDGLCRRVPGVKPFVFARNCNIGIGSALDAVLKVISINDPETVLIASTVLDSFILLNDDALLKTPGGFTALAKTASEHPEYGVISAATNNVGNKNQWPRGTGELRDEPRMVCFVAVCVPRTTIDRVGLLDERYIGYGADDDDYCFTARAAGLKIGVLDACHVDHKSLVSTFRGGATNGGDFRPNMKLFIEKWGHDNWGRPARV